MSEIKYKTGWIKDPEGNKFAPITTTDQVITSDGADLASEINNMKNDVTTLNSKLIPKKIIDNITPSDGQTISFSSNAKILMVEVGNPSVNASILVPNIITTKPYIVTAVWDAGSNTYTRLTFKIVDGGLKVDTIYASGDWATTTKYVSVYEVG